MLKCKQKDAKLSVKFKNFHIMNPSVIDMEPQSSTYNMKPLNTSSSRVHHQHPAIGRVTHYFKDMRVAADKHIGTVFID